MVKKLGGKVVKFFLDSSLVTGKLKVSWRPRIIGCKDIWVKLGNYNLALRPSLYSRSRGVKILIQTLWQL